MIVGQVGGGLGTRRPPRRARRTPRSATTWPIASAGADVHAAAAGTARAVVRHRSGGGSDDRADLERCLSPGTYLIESGTHPSIQGPMGLYGILVVTAAPTATQLATPADAPTRARLSARA